MSENIEEQELSTDELIKQNAKLRKENDKVKKRLERVTDQGDRQHKQFEKLNEKLETYIDVMDDHVIAISTDKNKKITTVSTAFSNNFGFKPKEIIGKSLEFLIDKDDLEKIEVELQDVVASKERWHGELKFKSKSEHVIWTETIITPVYDESELDGFTFISEDISQERELKDLKSKQLSKKKYDQSMLEFMSSKSSALLQRTSNSFSYILWIITATILWAIVWANYAELEELTRGSGKILPSEQVKRVESFDNARVSEILVREGDVVKKGQLLLRFNNIENSATLKQNSLRLKELKAKARRLELEANLVQPENAKFLNDIQTDAVHEELVLYRADMLQLNLKTSAMREKIKQKRSELDEAQKKEQHLKNNFTLLKQELSIKEQMAKEKIISEIEYIQLKRQRNDLSQELNKIKNEIIRAKSVVNELGKNIQEVELEFKNRSKKEHHEVLSEIARLDQMHTSLSDQLTRAEILSPVNGTIKKMYVNTIGEVAQAGNPLLEIVPSDESIIAEIKIAPEDIAYIKLDQEAMMKFSSYDFSIYGGIKAKVNYISADTIMSPDDNKEYYMVHLKMQKDYLGTKENPLKIKVGMVADVDIIHGKKSVMDYILKPILKAKQNALTEK
ncbi:MAG: HlyD family type I secretion periplasmic adaptor subunit [Helicobacteraceae bacterium]|nr:HlyD family type I secretion periplasmic adaptor subunit [Helicobacteraceae bacterium]